MKLSPFLLLIFFAFILVCAAFNPGTEEDMNERFSGFRIQQEYCDHLLKVCRQNDFCVARCAFQIRAVENYCVEGDLMLERCLRNLYKN